MRRGDGRQGKVDEEIMVEGNRNGEIFIMNGRERGVRKGRGEEERKEEGREGTKGTGPRKERK